LMAFGFWHGRRLGLCRAGARAKQLPTPGKDSG
jgi:hypothetical protein